MKNHNCVTVITHDGPFHADDVTACAILKVALHTKQINIVRTRDDDILQKSIKENCENPGKIKNIILDVGGQFNQHLHIYDHHMRKEDQQKRITGEAYSSVGLIWCYFGHDYISAVLKSSGHTNLNQKTIDAVFNQIDSEFIRHIDLYDNGNMTILPARTDYIFMIDILNHNDDGFEMALNIAHCVLTASVKKIYNQILNDQTIQRQIDASPDKRYVFLESAIDIDAVAQKPANLALMFYLYQTENKFWRIKVIRKSMASFEARKDLPAQWGGLSKKGLQAITGCESAVFCHQSLFIAEAKTKEDIQKMLLIALQS